MSNLRRAAHKRLALNSFPITTSQSFPALWNVHYVNLAKSPVVNTNMKWLPAHLELSLSDSELSCLKALDRSKLATITSLKAMISRMLSDVFHIGQPPHLILLRLSPNSGYACNVLVLFLECLRLDLSAHTVVADASVLALTPAVLEIQAGQQLLDLMEPSSEAMKFEINDAETTAWWQLLPVLAERCRTWTHTSSCKYSNDASESLQEEQNSNQDSPLCGCGSGQDILPSLLQSDWKDVAPYTTRIALSPLFAMAYLESIGSSARDKSFGLDVDTDDVPSGDVCRVCGGRGKPKIMSCSVCYKVKYCSRACQKGDWKRHKVECRKGLAKGNF
ncbi:hypothetical protein H0H81_001126 [Sphagnurus paluster]|uniref:MYND-type domain-containing protein n=1 Tax=Sphagnurus paluster TaxID=117069 RepID=A0A9P7K1S5_9AGAR|nr:hypothetical protein H0H81_001126 [Sphagnurus paluster]